MKEKLRKIFLPRKKESKLPWAILFILSTVLLLLPVFFRVQYQELTALGLIGLFLINFIGSSTVFLPTPALISVAVSAATSHPILVAFIAAVASSLGEGVAFLFGYSSHRFINFKRHPILHKLTDLIFKSGKGVLIPIIAFIPNPIFDGIGILAGVTHYPIKWFLFLTFIGRFARYILIAYFGLSLFEYFVNLY